LHALGLMGLMGLPGDRDCLLTSGATMDQWILRLESEVHTPGPHSFRTHELEARAGALAHLEQATHLNVASSLETENS
jgi:hypothetical protein